MLAHFSVGFRAFVSSSFLMLCLMPGFLEEKTTGFGRTLRLATELSDESAVMNALGGVVFCWSIIAVEVQEKR
jgi:hypothetical protein